MNTKTALELSLVAAILEANPELDLDDADAVKRVIRAETGARRVEAATVAEFRELAEQAQAEIEQDDDAPASRSIVPMTYKSRYKAFGGNCGDRIAAELKAYLVDPDSDGINIVKLRRFADANGLWNPRYEDLNVGQQRMNVGNRLRAAVKRDPDLEVVWPA